jgi:hypothetical protein
MEAALIYQLQVLLGAHTHTEKGEREKEERERDLGRVPGV